MPQSLSAVHIHWVFSTKGREPFLRNAQMREEMHAYLGGISKELDCPPVIVGEHGRSRASLVRIGLSHFTSRLGKRDQTGFKHLDQTKRACIGEFP
jgi:hypothetical protein